MASCVAGGVGLDFSTTATTTTTTTTSTAQEILQMFADCRSLAQSYNDEIDIHPSYAAPEFDSAISPNDKVWELELPTCNTTSFLIFVEGAKSVLVKIKSLFFP